VATAAVSQGSANPRGGERWGRPTPGLTVVVLVLAATALVASLADARPATARAAASEPTGVVRRDGSSRNVLAFAAGAAILLLAAGGTAFLLLRGPSRRWRRAATAAVSHGRAEDQLFTLTPMVPRSPDQPYLVIVPGRMGWGDRLVEREGELPTPGEVIVDDELGTNGQAYVVEDVEPSPLPEDTRPCAILRAL
jgi:hypothetical protein